MYEIIWQFRAKPELHTQFETAYGSEGVWARFFRDGDGFVETCLLTDPDDPGRYLTIDRWRSREQYAAFARANHAAYRKLDQECERLTVEETRIGGFIRT